MIATRVMGEWHYPNKGDLPPIDEWVIVATQDYQKPIDVMTYIGRRIGKCSSSETDFEWQEYEYDAWTSGNGDILDENPIAWMHGPDISMFSNASNDNEVSE